MSGLTDCLDCVTDRPLGTVVHVNPGEIEVLQRYVALGAQRVVLVIGDAELLPTWRRLAPVGLSLEIVEVVVAAQSGSAVWLRYNVPGVAGMLEPAALLDYYPRLQVVQRVPVDSIGLHEVLQRLNIAVSTDRPNLLVLEAPGNDAELLNSLPATSLVSFAWLLVRGARQGLFHGGVAEEAAAEILHARCYRTVHGAAETEPLWPVTLMRFDAAAAERAALADRVQVLQTEVSNLTALHDEGAALVKVQLQARAAAENLAAERAALVEQIGKVRDEHAKQAAERQKRIAQLDAELTDLTARYAMLQEELIKAEAHVELISDLLFREPVR